MLSACVSSEVRCVRACVWLTVPSHRRPLGPSGGPTPWLGPGSKLCPWPSPQPPGPDEAGCAGTGVADSWTAPRTGLEARGPSASPALHTCAQRQRTSVPLPSRPGLSPVWTSVASGGPRGKCHLPAGSPPRQDASTVVPAPHSLLLCNPPEAGESEESGLGAAVHSQSSAAGLCQPCAPSAA